MKIAYATGAYFGERNVSHPRYKEDYTWYLQKHIEFINRQTIKIDKIYFICKFAAGVDKDTILDKIKSTIVDERVIVVEKENLGAVYCSWKDALHLDNGESDYVILTEDDYTLFDEDSVKLLLEYFSENKDLFYLCQYWSDVPYNKDGVNVSAHAALSSGIINNKLYHEFRVEHGIDFKVRYGTGYNIYCGNQAEFLDDYYRMGFVFNDIRKKYSVYYPHSAIEFGNSNGKKLIIPIDRDLGYF